MLSIDRLLEFAPLPAVFWPVLGAIALVYILTFRYIRNELAYPRIALASFIGYVFSHNIHLSLLGGATIYVDGGMTLYPGFERIRSARPRPVCCEVSRGRW